MGKLMHRRVARARRGALVLLVGVLLLCGSSGWTAATAGDEELGKFLLEHGRKALDKGDAEDAVTKLDKARQEDASLLEATYWLGVAHEKLDARRRAVDEYRAFVVAVESAAATRKLSRDESSLVKKARSRLDALDPAGRAMDKVNDSFVAKLVEFAAGQAKEDPDLAVRALKIALDLLPDHVEAKQALAALDKGGSSVIFAGLDDHWDLLRASIFGTNPGWTYSKEGRTVSIEGKPQGTLVSPPTPFRSGSHFAIEVDVTCTAHIHPQRTPVFGIGFGYDKSGGGYALLSIPQSVRLEKALTTKFAKMDDAPAPDWAPGVRRVMSVLVQGRRVRCYLNGEQVIDHEVDSDPGDDLRLFYDSVSVRIDRLELAKPEEKK